MFADEYVEHAQECECLAAIARLVRNREALLASAVMWRKLASEAAQADGAKAKPSIQSASAPE
jgi:hypothetical protein